MRFNEFKILKEYDLMGRLFGGPMPDTAKSDKRTDFAPDSPEYGSDWTTVFGPKAPKLAVDPKTGDVDDSGITWPNNNTKPPVVTTAPIDVDPKKLEPPKPAPSTVKDKVKDTVETVHNKVEEVAKNLGIEKSYLYSIIHHETAGTWDPAKPNGMGSGAVGLIQFMPDTATALGTTTQDLAKMTIVEQLAYVEKFYKMVGVKPGMDIGDIYMMTFAPKYVYDNDRILGQAGNYKVLPGFKGASLDTIYRQNSVFDHGDPARHKPKKGFFTVADIKNHINTYMK